MTRYFKYLATGLLLPFLFSCDKEPNRGNGPYETITLESYVTVYHPLESITLYSDGERILIYEIPPVRITPSCRE